MDILGVVRYDDQGIGLMGAAHTALVGAFENSGQFSVGERIAGLQAVLEGQCLPLSVLEAFAASLHDGFRQYLRIVELYLPLAGMSRQSERLIATLAFLVQTLLGIPEKVHATDFLAGRRIAWRVAGFRPLRSAFSFTPHLPNQKPAGLPRIPFLTPGKGEPGASGRVRAHAPGRIGISIVSSRFTHEMRSIRENLLAPIHQSTMLKNPQRQAKATSQAEENGETRKNQTSSPVVLRYLGILRIAYRNRQLDAAQGKTS